MNRKSHHCRWYENIWNENITRRITATMRMLSVIMTGCLKQKKETNLHARMKLENMKCEQWNGPTLLSCSSCMWKMEEMWKFTAFEWLNQHMFQGECHQTQKQTQNTSSWMQRARAKYVEIPSKMLFAENIAKDFREWKIPTRSKPNKSVSSH